MLQRCTRARLRTQIFIMQVLFYRSQCHRLYVEKHPPGLDTWFVEKLNSARDIYLGNLGNCTLTDILKTLKARKGQIYHLQQ